MILFYLLVAVMPLVKHPLWSLTRFGDLTMNKYLGIGCLFVALVYLAARTTPLRLFEGWQPKLFVGFGVATIMSFLIAGPDMAVEVSPLSNWVSFVLLFFTTAVLLDSVERLRWTLLALVGGVAFTSLHLLREWQAYGSSRPGWVTGDPNYFALTALLVMPLGLLLALRQGLPRIQRLFCLGCFLVTLFAFALAGSRGGLLGLVVGGLVMTWRSRHRWRYFIAGGVLVAVLALTPTSPVERLLNPGHGDQRSTNDRLALLAAGVRMFEDNFLTGIGVGKYKGVVGMYGAVDERLRNVAHNTYMEVANELGIVGILAFAAIFYGSLRRVRSIPRPAPTPLIETAALGIELGLISAVIGIFFLSALHVRLLWFMVILALRLNILVSDIALPAPAPPPARGKRIQAAPAR